MTGIHSNGSEGKVLGEVLGLRDSIGEIQAAIADFEVGKRLNVAIIAEPLGGKTTLLNEIEKLNLSRVTKITFSKIVRDKKEISLPEDTKRVVLLDNCQFLYMRRSGGFEVFYEFLHMISSQNSIFITTWNTYAWKYLNEVFRLEKYFPVQVFIPALEKEDLKDLILGRYEEGEIIFDSGNKVKEKALIYIEDYPLELASLGRKVYIPVLKINISYLKKRLLNEKEKEREEEKETAEDRVFGEIYRESKGNPGIALRIWELEIDYPHIEPEGVRHFSYDIELEQEEAFVLELILSYQGLRKSEIVDIVGSMLRTDEILFQLLNQELIFEHENGSIRVRPEALRSVIAYLEKLRLVW
ncbi:hypothetical protein FXV91_08810 [Methanosarcina sp. DH2]|uniref:hypothetical protein n=1 Tax=Methanosarcina sp. DH2 TaxID=2605639 RepID=UPI001E4D5F5D|nr:hypothetical protein [Methanosarcina sp. DH2]MCC4770286.1 hypothetical protein [Methanosarcina sp. DH2]